MTRNAPPLFQPVSSKCAPASAASGNKPIRGQNRGAIRGAIRCVSIDVEEYFQIEAARGAVGRGRWGDWPSRVERNMDLLLDLFDRTGCRATFFFLGCVAEKHPDLARRCADMGHEVASHGSMHDRLHRLTPETMRKDVLGSKRLLEDQTGRAVVGYRAPTWSLTRETSWAVDVLGEAGFKYDASVFPVRHPMYGVADAPDWPCYLEGSAGGDGGAGLLEVPPLTWRVMGKKLAVAGGGYFRLLPLSLMKRGLAQAALEGRPAVLYFHPWEFDPGMPRMPLGLAGRVRTYTGLKNAAGKLEEIIRGYAGWRPIGDCLGELGAMAKKTGVFRLRRQAAA
jgi:polysaccharide deacetylase family protein (PEP-CTERM system associated)